MSTDIKTLSERIKPNAWLTPGETGNILAASMQEAAELRARTHADAKLIAGQNRLAEERQEWALHTNEVIRELRAALALAQAPSAPVDVCAQMRALCSACGGTGDVHSIDGEWRGSCDCQASAPVAPDELALLAARAEGRAEAVLMIMVEDPEDCLNDCMVGSGPCPASGEYDTHWDEEKLRAKFKAGDSTINMETKAELAYYEYMEARMVLEYEAMHRRDLAAPNFEAWFKAAAEEYKAYDRDYSRKVWEAAILSCSAALSVKAGPITTDAVMKLIVRAEHSAFRKEPVYLIDRADVLKLLAAPTPPTTGEA